MLRRRSTTQEVVEGIHINSAQARVMLSGNDELTLAAADLVEGVERVGESMRETTGAAESAADATSHVEAGASAVASASSQIAVAMQEVSSSAASATIVTSEAGIITTQARESVELLVASSQEITGVIVTVNKIADQTRMLALNATIEATRAGDSGHGFAVVAEEVKNLSSLTGQATTEIGDQLDALITNAESVRAGFARIDEVLGRIDELQHTIAAAVEEETAAIAEITRAADQAALAAQDLEQSVSSSANAARVAASAVDRSRTWLERVAAALESQRHAMTTLSDNVEVHPLHAAVKAHAAWKTNLRLAAETGRVPAGIDRTKAGRSDACAFGKWLVAGEGDAADPKHAPRVAELHARFHQAASAILETAVSGRTEDARQMLADEHGYRDISNELIDALLEWLSSVE